MAAQGIATIGITSVGNGFGPLSTFTVTPSVGDPVAFSSHGRGIDQNGDNAIGSSEGFQTPAPRTIIWERDGRRQTVADLMQLVRVIEGGMDVDGDGTRDLDSSHISVFGHSQGGHYVTMFLAVEPSVRAGVVAATGGSIAETRRLSTGGGRSQDIGNRLLASRIPSLINPPGVISMGGISTIGAPHFNENLPLRDGIPLTVQLADGTTHTIQSPVMNTVVGAMELQTFFENAEWVNQPGNPVAYAPHLRKDSLPGVPAKSVIVQFARGDQNVPNPTTTALLRAGDLADRATFYRHDLAYAENPALPKNPHGYLISAGSAAFRAIALGTQEQIAAFFASDGRDIIHPEPSRFFEVPVVLPLPEDLNFIP